MNKGIEKSLKCDFSKWKVNMHVLIINNIGDVRLVGDEICPTGYDKNSSKKIKDGYCSNCSYYMGCNTSGKVGYVGEQLSGCCWGKIILKQK